jgi:hypothetical protein
MIRSFFRTAAPLVALVAWMTPAATAAPVIHASALNRAAASQVDTVHWRGRWGGYGGWNGAWGWSGFAAGALLGAAWARPYYAPFVYPYAAYDSFYTDDFYYEPPLYRTIYPPAAVYPAAPRAYYGAAADADLVDYCRQRYRTYNRRTGTFMGNDGRRHPCP